MKRNTENKKKKNDVNERKFFLKCLCTEFGQQIQLIIITSFVQALYLN